MEKINFEDGQLTKKGYVVIDGKEYLINEAQYDGATPLSAYVLNKMQDNIEEGINNIQALPTGGTKGQVLTKQSETNGDANWEDIEANEVFVGNEEEAPSSAKIIVEEDDFVEGSTLGKAEVYVGAEEPITGEKVWFRKGKQLFNKNDVKYGYELNGTNGSVVKNELDFVSDYIKVYPGQKLYKSGAIAGTSNCFYDENKKFISTVRIVSGVISVPAINSISYMRINGVLTDLDSIQITSGDTQSAYEAYIEPKIFIKNLNGIYEEFINNNTKELTFTKNEADNIFYDSIYATENEVQISADIRYNFAKGTKIKVLTIEKGYEALISNVDGVARFPISTDSGVGTTGYADVNTKGEVYITTLGTAKAAFINIRYRYK